MFWQLVLASFVGSFLGVACWVSIVALPDAIGRWRRRRADRRELSRLVVNSKKGSGRRG